MTTFCFILVHLTGGWGTDIPTYVNVGKINTIQARVDSTKIYFDGGWLIKTRETAPEVMKRIKACSKTTAQ